MCPLDLDLIAVVSENTRIERELIRLPRLHEASGAKCPVVMKVFQRKTPRVTARISSEVEGAMRDEGPVQKLSARVVAIGIVVEEVGDGHVTSGHHHAALVDAARELIRVGFDGVGSTAQAPSLAQEQARTIEDGMRSSRASDLAVREAT
jgi:hypothetical protein